jgi:hypothetical protein
MPDRFCWAPDMPEKMGITPDLVRIPEKALAGI